MRASAFLFSTALLSVLVPAQRPINATQRPDAEILKFGVYTSERATSIYRMLLPLVEALQTSMDAKLPDAVDIQFKVCKTYEEAQDAIVAGEIDFSKFGPASYVLVKQRSPGIQLLAMENNDGKKSFEGFVVVRSDSRFRTLADLKGTRFAFGDETSTIGRYLVQHELLRAGLCGEDFRKYEFLGRHDKVFKAVELGDFEAGAVRDNTFAKMNKDKKLRVLARFDNVTQPWIARSGLDPKIVKALRQSLLELKDPEALRGIKADGFFPAEDSDYDVIRDAIRSSDAFAKPRKPVPQPGARPGR